MIGHVWNQISDSWVSVYSGNVDSDFITVANTLPVTVKIHFWMLAKKFYLLYWVLKKKKKTLNEKRISTYQDKISGLIYNKRWGTRSNFRCCLSANLNILDWRWKITKRCMVSIDMSKEIAPPDLIKTVKCGCRKGSTQKYCTCRQNGAMCRNMFSSCRDTPFSNLEQISCFELW